MQQLHLIDLHGWMTIEASEGRFKRAVAGHTAAAEEGAHRRR
jgi:hypothetical protein